MVSGAPQLLAGTFRRYNPLKHYAWKGSGHLSARARCDSPLLGHLFRPEVYVSLAIGIRSHQHASSKNNNFNNNDINNIHILHSALRDTTTKRMYQSKKMR